MAMIKGSASPSSAASTAQPRLHTVTCASTAGLHRMAYQEWGDPDNPRVVVCVHGLTRRSDDFAWLARALASDARVVCPDVVGRGRSEWLKDPMLYGIPQYTSDMVTLIARLNVPSVHWVGTSMGGLIGMSLAALPNSPVERLVLNDVGAVLSGEALARIAAYVGVETDFPGRDVAHAVLRRIFSGFGEHTPQEWEALCDCMLIEDTSSGRYRLHYDPQIAAPFRATYGSSSKAGASALTPPADIELWPIYDAIACPTLVMRGAQSDLLPASVAHDMTQRGPKARMVEVADVGHAPTLIRPDQIAVVRDFLGLGR